MLSEIVKYIIYYFRQNNEEKNLNKPGLLVHGTICTGIHLSHHFLYKIIMLLRYRIVGMVYLVGEMYPLQHG